MNKKQYIKPTSEISEIEMDKCLLFTASSTTSFTISDEDPIKYEECGDAKGRGNDESVFGSLW